MLIAAYEAFNARDVESVLAAMHPDVVWPNGMEGGHVHGHPVVHHVYHLRDGLIRTTEIREPSSKS